MIEWKRHRDGRLSASITVATIKTKARVEQLSRGWMATIHGRCVDNPSDKHRLWPSEAAACAAIEEAIKS